MELVRFDSFEDLPVMKERVKSDWAGRESFDRNEMLEAWGVESSGGGLSVYEMLEESPLAVELMSSRLPQVEIQSEAMTALCMYYQGFPPTLVDGCTLISASLNKPPHFDQSLRSNVS